MTFSIIFFLFLHAHINAALFQALSFTNIVITPLAKTHNHMFLCNILRMLVQVYSRYWLSFVQICRPVVNLLG